MHGEGASFVSCNQKIKRLQKGCEIFILGEKDPICSQIISKN